MKIINFLIKFLIFILIIIFLYSLKKDYYNSYNYFYVYVFIGTTIIYLLACLKLNKNLKINFFISLLSFFFSIYLVEIFFFLNTTFFKNKIYDSREKIEVIYDFRNKKIESTLSIPPSTFLKENDNIFPLAGISNSLTILCNETGKWVAYKSDRYGFNNPDISWDNSEITNLLIGDSFVHGHCVDYNKTFAGNMEKENIKVLSMAYAGTGPLIHLGYFKEYASNKKIKNIILFYYEENDLIDLYNENKSIILSGYKLHNYSQNLTNKQDLIDSKLNNLIEKRYSKFNNFNHKFFKLIKLFHVRKFISLYLHKKEDLDNNLLNKFNHLDHYKILDEYSIILNHFKNFAKLNNSSLTVVYLPSFTRYSKNEFNTNKLFLKNEVINIYKNNLINFIDVDLELFANYINPKIFFQNQTDNHYTEEAYKLISELIVKKINDK